MDIPLNTSTGSRTNPVTPEGKHVLKGLPPEAYTSEDYFRLEQERVFARNWTFVGFAHELAEAGTAIPVQAAGQPLLLLTNEQGEIGVFHNVCRHRGLQLVQERCKVEQSLTCPYHAWSYGLDGGLESAPHFGGFRIQEVPGFKRCDFGLKAVRFHIWKDWIFVNVDGKAPAFEECLASFKAVLEEVEYTRLEPIGKIDLGEVKANWKLLMENFIEPYHVPIVHNVTAAGQPLKDHYTIAKGLCNGAGIDLENSKQIQEVSDNLDMSARYLTLFPNFVLGVYLPDQSGVHLNVPVSAGVTRQYRVLYGINGRAYSAEERRKLCELWRAVHKEDHDIVERLQLGRASSVMNDGGVLSPYWEDSVHAFQSLIVKAMA